MPAPPATTALPRALVLNVPAVLPLVMPSTMRWTSASVRVAAILVPIKGTMWRAMRPSSIAAVDARLGCPNRVKTCPPLSAARIGVTELRHRHGASLGMALDRRVMAHAGRCQKLAGLCPCLIGCSRAENSE